MHSLRIFSVLFILFLSQILVSAQTKTIAELPMKFRGPSPAVEVMVNGQGPFLFALDTGAQGQGRIDSSLVEKLGLKPNGQIGGSDSSGQNVRAMNTYELDSIKIGDITFEKVSAASRNYNDLPGAPRIDGILGFNLFADYILTLDYPGKKIRLEKGALPASNGTNILDFENSRGVPVIDLQIGNQKIKADIDSGNMVGAFMLPTTIVEKAATASEPMVVGRARTVSNDVEIKQVRLKDNIRLGSFEFTEPTVTFPGPAANAGNIGSKTLSQFVIAFDQKNKRVKFERTGSDSNTSAAKIENPKDYAGSYGDRTITEENGSLFIQRPNGMRLKLVPIARDEFTLEQIPAARFKFTRDASGNITEIQVLNPQGTWEKVSKGNF